jgi:hypothetical protein
MAVFYGQFQNDSFKRQMKENRKIEELILMFATHATGVLKKEPSLAGDGWKIELNNQIAQFVKLLRESLRGITLVPAELHTRLDSYYTKLAITTSPSTMTYSDSGYDSSSTHRDRDSVSTPPLPSGNIADMPLVRTAARLFKMSESTAQREIDQIKQVSTQKAALIDLKTCLKNINVGAQFPGRRDDFSSEEAWQSWRSAETSQLSTLILSLLKQKPELAKSQLSDSFPPSSQPGTRPLSTYCPIGSRPKSVSVASRRSVLLVGANNYTMEDQQQFNGVEYDDDDVQCSLTFTYIPPNSKKYYKRLLESCLIADLEIMLSPEVDDNDEVSLGILSPAHLELLNECALRWRIGQPYRVACFLDLVKFFYERNDVPVECIPEALQNVTKALEETELLKWPIQDAEYLGTIYAGILNVFLSALYHAMDLLPNVKPSQLEPMLLVLNHVQGSGLLEMFRVDIRSRVREVQEQVRKVAARGYDSKFQELQAAPGVNRALPLLFMTDEIEKSAKTLDKRFADPLLGLIDIVALFVGVQIPCFFADLQASGKRLSESSTNGPTPDVPIQDIFALYRRAKVLMSMHEAFCPSFQLDFNAASFFEPYVLQWLVSTDDKTTQWVQAAIAADKFESEGTEGHSSSVVDLFDSLRSPIAVLQDLEWSDPYQEARFYTSLSKVRAHISFGKRKRCQPLFSCSSW